MSVRVRDLMTSGFGQLRHEPTAKRIRAMLGGTPVIDSTRAVLVWEPRRVVPSYAVPAQDIRGELVPARPVAPGGTETGRQIRDLSERPLLDPSFPFAVHTAEGEAVDVRADGHDCPVPGSASLTPTWPGMLCSISRPSTRGSKRMSPTWPIRVTPSIESTWSPVRGRCALS